MGNFNKGGGGSRFGGKSGGGSRGGFGSRPGGRSNDDCGERKMFRATCSDCGNDCEVPFKPTGSKPVLCSNCFTKSNDDGRPQRRNFEREERSPQPHGVSQAHFDQQIELLNDKLDKILKRITPSHLRPKPGAANGTEDVEDTEEPALD